MSCLPLLFLGNGAHALTINEVVQPTETTTADHSGFYLLQLVTPSKALVIILVVVTMIVYLLLCFWLSIGWLHFAKRLIFGATVPYRKEDGNDPEAVYLKEDPADYESDSASEPETETRCAHCESFNVFNCLQIQNKIQDRIEYEAWHDGRL